MLCPTSIPVPVLPTVNLESFIESIFLVSSINIPLLLVPFTLYVESETEAAVVFLIYKPLLLVPFKLNEELLTAKLVEPSSIIALSLSPFTLKSASIVSDPPLALTPLFP